MRRHPLLAVALISLVATAAGIAISFAIDWFPAQGSTAAEDIDVLWDVLMTASVPVFVLVMAVVIYSVYAFRAKPGDYSDGAPIHGSTKLEIIWVTIPFIMVSVLAAYGWIVLDDIEEKADDQLIVNVRGQQFAWDFVYPGENRVASNQLVVPTGRQIEFRVKTADVLHDFWVPEWRLKTDAVPGITTKIRVTPTRTGNFSIVCAELCGIGHSTMRQAVKVVDPAAFDAWVRQKAAGGPQASSTGYGSGVDAGGNG